jgi:hypothetical protein
MLREQKFPEYLGSRGALLQLAMSGDSLRASSILKIV